MRRSQAQRERERERETDRQIETETESEKESERLRLYLDLDTVLSLTTTAEMLSCHVFLSQCRHLNHYCIPACWLNLSLLLSCLKNLQGFWELGFSLFVS